MSAPKSEALRVRLIDHEKAAFNALAETLGVPPSTLLRRMVREAVSAGPTLFKDDLGPVIDAAMRSALLAETSIRSLAPSTLERWRSARLSELTLHVLLRCCSH